MVVHLLLSAIFLAGPEPTTAAETEAVADTEGETEADEAVAEEPEEPEEPEDPPPARWPKLEEPVRVVVAGSAPFVVVDGGKPDGVAVDLWEAVAARAEVPYRLEVAETIPKALEGLVAGRYDVAIGPISITAHRAERVAFTQPYYESPLSIVSTSEGTSTWDRLRPFFTKAFGLGVGILLLVLAIVGVAFWWTERKHNPNQFSSDPIKGIGAGLWLALVTMTTVGYGDKAPVTSAGRFVAGLWMVVAMLTASSLTASIATALTLSQIGGEGIDAPDKLSGRKVAVVRGAPAAGFARQHGARIETVESVKDGLDRLAKGEVEALVHDRAVLAHELDGRDDETELLLTSGEYEVRGYGFAVTMGSSLVHRLDPAVLQVRESGMVRELLP